MTRASGRPRPWPAALVVVRGSDRGTRHMLSERTEIGPSPPAAIIVPGATSTIVVELQEDQWFHAIDGGPSEPLPLRHRLRVGPDCELQLLGGPTLDEEWHDILYWMAYHREFGGE